MKTDIKKISSQKLAFENHMLECNKKRGMDLHDLAEFQKLLDTIIEINENNIYKDAAINLCLICIEYLIKTATPEECNINNFIKMINSCILDENDAQWQSAFDILISDYFKSYPNSHNIRYLYDSVKLLSREIRFIVYYIKTSFKEFLYIENELIDTEPIISPITLEEIKYAYDKREKNPRTKSWYSLKIMQYLDTYIRNEILRTSNTDFNNSTTEDREQKIMLSILEHLEDYNPYKCDPISYFSPYIKNGL